MIEVAEIIGKVVLTILLGAVTIGDAWMIVSGIIFGSISKSIEQDMDEETNTIRSMTWALLIVGIVLGVFIVWGWCGLINWWRM